MQTETRQVGKSLQSAANMFYQDVVKWRQNGAKLWSIIIIFLLTLVHSVTADYSVFNHTSLIITGFFWNLFQLNFWFYTIIIMAIYWLSFIFYDQLFTFSPKVYSNSFEKLSNIFYSLGFVCLVSNLISSIAISFILLQFYKSTNEINVIFVTFFCAFSSFINKFQFILDKNFMINWPIIEQTKYVRFKSRLYSIVLNTIRSIITNLFVWKFCLFVIRSGLARIFYIDSQDNETETFSSITTLTCAIKLSFIINISHEISWNLYEIYLTEIYHFEIQPTDPSQLPLTTAMTFNSHPYIQTLAMLDFSDLSTYSKNRRRQLFTLNYSSGKPLNWIKSSTEALNVIKEFMDVFNFDDMLHGSGKTNNINFENRPTGSLLYKRANLLTSPSHFQPLSSPITSPLKIYDEKTRLMSPRQTMNQNKILSNKQNQYESSLAHKALDMIKKLKLVSYFYKENPNCKTQALFVDSFLVINSLKGLSNLVSASKTEDEFGIVQQNLVDIITTFTELLKILEMYNPSYTNGNISFKVLQKKNPDPIELYMQKLTLVLNESLYKITETFGTSLNTLNLSDNVLKIIKRYYLI